MAVPRSSGDLIADRRYEYVRMMLAEKDFAGAADLLSQLVEMVPQWVVGWFAYGDALAELERPGEACAAYTRCLELSPGDELGAGLKLSRLRGEQPDHPPEDYVKGLFDDYAGRFESELVERLAYRTPSHLMDLIRSTGRARFVRVMDLGCGTGLMAEELRGSADYLAGVDLSPAMVAEARRKGRYDALIAGDAVRELEADSSAYDLIVAADVFVYLGRLEEIFAAAKARLAPGGILAFSVERSDGEDVQLRQSLRYAHSLAYLDRLAAGHGLMRLAERTGALRRDRGADIIGHLVVYG